jgi:uncharacterized membrane protein YeiH
LPVSGRSGGYFPHGRALCLYLLLQAAGLKRSQCFLLGFACIVALRLLAISFDWHLPVFASPNR